MQRNRLSFVDRLGLALLKKGLHLITLCATILSCALLLAAKERWKIEAAGYLAALALILGLAMAFFTVPEVIDRMRRDKAVLLSDSICQTFSSYLMMASFLPFVGPLLDRLVAKQKNPFTQSDE